ncbi:MAG: methionine--tRNA ligase [Flavobacteriaceae bacterium]|nr:methionine--tRNA ligase [Flavobacteriaceae bacterium]
MKPKRYTVTAALPYTNGPIHIGHLAGVYIPADIYCRYLRARKRDVVYICGSDEHGVAISMKARQEGIEPKELIDKYHLMIEKSFKAFGISFDNYSRTSRNIHHQTTQEIFLELYRKGIFEEKESTQLYDPKENQFLADRYVIGTCPVCGHDEAYGDQCEKCGSSLSVMDLINPKSTISNARPIPKKTKHWYLPMEKYHEFIKQWILEKHKDDWKTNVYGQVKSWVDQGFNPRAITRDLDWGVKVPIKGYEDKVFYVWFDAPIGYISSTKEWAEKKGVDWRPYWQDKKTELYHFIGKDNIVFHCIIFPMILNETENYIIPKNVPANEFLNLEGKKLSTSKNWAVWLHEYLEDFPGKQDVLRYVLTATAPETSDSDFTWSDFQARNNNELVANLGNFVNRTLVLMDKYFNREVPKRGELNSQDVDFLSNIQKAPEKISSHIEKFKFRDAIAEFMDLSRSGNKYLAEQEPWKIIKTDKQRVGTTLILCLQLVSSLSVLGAPFLPFTSKKIEKILNKDGKMPSWNDIKANNILFEEGHLINKPERLFDKIDNKEIQHQLDKLKNIDSMNDEPSDFPPKKPDVSYEDFSALDLRVATILEAEKVPKTDKLIKVCLSDGDQTRTVVSGIFPHYQPEELLGKQVILLANLKPRKLRGIQSHGMLLLAEDEKGIPIFIRPESSDSISGQKIG